MVFSVIPNLSPPSFTRLINLNIQSSSSSSSSSSSYSHNNNTNNKSLSHYPIHHHHHNHNNTNNCHGGGGGGLGVQSAVEPPPVRVRVSPPPDPRQDFYVNLGLAVRTLRHDLPLIFSTDLNYDIYRDDITFVDPLNKFTGIDNYKIIFRALRFHGRILFKEISLEVFRVWQPSENLILIRWNLKGVPRVPWEAKGEFQGTSRFKLDRNGKIYEHKVDNLAFNFPQQFKPAVSVLDLVAASPPATPNPTFSWGALDSTYSSSWLDFYRAVKNTLDPSQDFLVLQDCQLVAATCL